MTYCCIMSQFIRKHHWEEAHWCCNTLLELEPFVSFPWALCADSNVCFQNGMCNIGSEEETTHHMFWSSTARPFSCKRLLKVMVITIHFAIKHGHLGAFHQINIHRQPKLIPNLDCIQRYIFLLEKITCRKINIDSLSSSFSLIYMTLTAKKT